MHGVVKQLTFKYTYKQAFNLIPHKTTKSILVCFNHFFKDSILEVCV